MTIREVNHFQNRICVITLNNGKKFTAMVYRNDHEICYFGHPLEEDGNIWCGGSHVYKARDIKRIDLASIKECKVWIDKTRAFDRETIAEKGYNACKDPISTFYDFDERSEEICADVERHLNVLGVVKDKCIKQIATLLWQNENDEAHHLALTVHVDGAYAPSACDELERYERISEVWLNSDNEPMYRTKWDLENMFEPSDADQWVADQMNATDCVDLLSSILQQIDDNKRMQEGKE